MWRRIGPYFLAFAAPTLLMFILLNILNKGLYPFGEHISAIGDTQLQYVPFQAYIKSAISGPDNLFYSFGKSIGGDFFSIFVSYCLSPFNLIYLLFPVEQLYTAFWIIATLKAGLAGLAMFAFLKSKNYRNSTLFGMMIFSTTYALSFYMIGYHYDMPWLDVVALLPFVAMGIDRIIQTGAVRTYCVSLLVTVFSNFYLGWMVCVFSALYFACRYLLRYKTGTEIKNHLQYLWRFVRASLVVILMLAVILIPAYIAVKNGYRVNSSTEYYNIYSLPEKLLPFFGAPVYFTHVDGIGYTAPFLFAGIAVPPLLIYYFLCKKISKRERLLSGMLVFVILSGLFIFPIDFFWHGFSNPIGNLSRYVFLFAFLAVSCAYHVFCGFKHKISLGIIIAALQLTSIFWYSVASLKTRYVTEYDPWTLQSNFELNLDAMTGVLADISSEDQSFYRVEFDPQVDKTDMSFLYGYNSFAVYTSNIESSTGNFMQKICAGQYNEIKYNTTLAVDSLFGIKYILAIDDDGEALSVIENDLALPVGFMVNGGASERGISGLDCMDAQNEIFQSLSGVDAPIVTAWDGEPRLNNLSREFYGESASYSTIDKGLEGYIIYDLPSSRNDVFYAYIDDLKFRHTTLESRHATEAFPYESYLFIGDEPTYSGENRPLTVTKKYTEFNPEKTLAVSVGDLFSTGGKIVYRESKSALSQHYAKLADEPCDLNKITSSHLTCTVEAKEDGDLFFTVPNDKGWTVKVDGEKVKTETAFDLFMTVPLAAGTHDIEMEYVPRGLKMGFVVSAFTLAGYLLGCRLCFRAKTRKTIAAALLGRVAR